MYPLNLRSKTRRRATLLLPTWIYSCQSVGTVKFTLPFTTSLAILFSILQTFRSWAATSHFHPPMAFLSHSSSDTPMLAPLINVLFWGWCDFPISFSGRYTYVKERCDQSLLNVSCFRTFEFRTSLGTSVFEYIHHFKSDLINNMELMRISGNVPSLVILSQTNGFNSWKWLPERAKNKLKLTGMV